MICGSAATFVMFSGDQRVRSDEPFSLPRRFAGQCRGNGLSIVVSPLTDNRNSSRELVTLARPSGDAAEINTVYTLTGIYRIGYIWSMRSAFEIIAEPNRRAIISLLVSSQQSVGQIERRLRMTQPTVSKHLRVLRDAGFVESRVDAQRRLYRLRPEPLQELDDWLAPFRRFWSTHVDALERHLDRMDQSTPTKKNEKRTRPKPRTRPRRRK